MENNTDINTELIDKLEQITSTGIQADMKRLKADMRAQFSDYREWIREYVVNAFDAMASFCRITGEENEEEITVTVSDNGKGMNQQRIKKFFTLYSSEKDIDPSQAIGTHGIGKLSVAAIPNQTRFELLTSDGKESWSVTTGKLDDDEDIVVQKHEQKIPQGSTFRISFKKTVSLFEEMSSLKKVLDKYVRFLPFQVSISIPESSENLDHQVEYIIKEDWCAYNEPYKQDFNVEVNGNSFDVQFGIGDSAHQIYQNKVLVSDKYNLLSYDLEEDWTPLFLTIRVNGSSFELPFGRHCLSNEDILKPLSKVLRNTLLPKFVRKVYGDLQQEDINHFQYRSNKLDLLTSSLIKLDSRTSMPWNNYDIIKTCELGKLSYRRLKEIVDEKGKFYIEDEENMGIDYSYLSEPVIHHSQVGELLSTLTTQFKDRCISLKNGDLVFELSREHGPELSNLQKTFEENLGFHPGLIGSEEPGLSDKQEYEKNPVYPGDSQSYIGEGFLNEIEEASNDFRKLRWRVSYLVEKDFTTPCISRLFVFSRDTVILNLYHPLIEKLVMLSKYNPKLAGHWGISLCLEDSRNVLPHLTADTRDEILMLDGIAKLQVEEVSYSNEKEKKAFKKLFNEFRNNINGSILDNLN